MAVPNSMQVQKNWADYSKTRGKNNTDLRISLPYSDIVGLKKHL